MLPKYGIQAGDLESVAICGTKENLFLVLSTYPSKEYQIGHAVGLDTMNSASKILNEMISNQFSVEKFKNGNLSQGKLNQVIETIREYEEVFKENSISHYFTNKGFRIPYSCHF